MEVEAHEVDTEALEPVKPVVERAGPVDEPGVVLDPEADAARGARSRSDDADEGAREKSGD
jgi:hypothetical protein